MAPLHGVRVFIHHLEVILDNALLAALISVWYSMVQASGRRKYKGKRNHFQTCCQLQRKLPTYLVGHALDATSHICRIRRQDLRIEQFLCILSIDRAGFCHTIRTKLWCITFT
jgi:hypothetical protein